MAQNNSELAGEIIRRLNGLIKDPEIRRDVGRLIDSRVAASPETCDHPTIQVKDDQLGFLGLMNVLVGTIEYGPQKGMGYITADFTDDHQLIGFRKTI